MSENKKITRAKFRNDVFTRDNYTCKKCGDNNFSFETFDAHHIINRDDMPNGGYVKENGITLCASCHMKAELVLNGDKPFPGFSTEELYDLIKSSYELAIKASEKLS